MTELKLVELAQPDNQGDIIEKLEEALEMARKGEVTSLGIVAVMRGGWTSCSYAKTNELSLMIACCSKLQYRLLKLLEE